MFGLTVGELSFSLSLSPPSPPRTSPNQRKMVKVTELDPASDSSDQYITEDEDRLYSDAGSDHHDVDALGEDDDQDDQDDIANETLWQRLVHLQDALPADRREQWKKSALQVGGHAWTATKFMGNVAWVLTTSAMLVVLPLMYEMDKEQMDVAFYEFQMAQAQKVRTKFSAKFSLVPSSSYTDLLSTLICLSA